MELIDKRIKEEFKKSDLPIPDDFDQMVHEKIAEGLEKSKNDKIISIQRRTKRLVASIVFVVTCSLFVGITGKANINYLKERMESLGEKDKKEIVDQADEASVPAAIFTREFSESEYERMELLRYKYESEGMYPEKELQIVNSEDEVDEDTICFYPKLCKYYLPERELTDEELLEYIDYGYKLDYALKERSDKEDEELDIEICSDDELKSLAMDKLTTCFGVDEKNLSVNIDLHNFYVGYYGDYERTADVNVYDAKNKDFYCVEIEAVSGTVREVYKNEGISKLYNFDEENRTKNKTEYDEQECMEKYEQLKSVAELYGGGSYEKGYIKTELFNEYIVDDNTLLCYRLANNKWIIIEYNFYNREVESITEEDDSSFEALSEWWTEDAKDNGYENKSIEN